MFKKSLIIVFLILIADQSLKIWIKTHMMLRESRVIFNDWFQIYFIENNGMAFGMEIGGINGKLFLSIFRIIAITGIGIYIYSLIKKKAHIGLVLSLSIIFAGALGNLIDSAFYGLIFNESVFQIAEIFPKEGGYASFLHGRVVDMFYFPLIEGHYPEWVPRFGGDQFIFFRPIFNIADSAVTVGVFLLLIFQGKFFAEPSKEEIAESTS